MTNLETIKQMSQEELAFFLCATQWNDLNTVHMMPKEDLAYFVNYLNKDGSSLIESVQYCMNDWNDYNKENENE